MPVDFRKPLDGSANHQRFSRLDFRFLLWHCLWPASNFEQFWAAESCIFRTLQSLSFSRLYLTPLVADQRPATAPTLQHLMRLIEQVFISLNTPTLKLLKRSTGETTSHFSFPSFPAASTPCVLRTGITPPISHPVPHPTRFAPASCPPSMNHSRQLFIFISIVYWCCKTCLHEFVLPSLFRPDFWRLHVKPAIWVAGRSLEFWFFMEHLHDCSVSTVQGCMQFSTFHNIRHSSKMSEVFWFAWTCASNSSIACSFVKLLGMLSSCVSRVALRHADSFELSGAVSPLQYAWGFEDCRDRATGLPQEVKKRGHWSVAKGGKDTWLAIGLPHRG